MTSWSWFGVNMLGVGLHCYGFTDAAFYWLIAFVASQLLIIVPGRVRSASIVAQLRAAATQGPARARNPPAADIQASHRRPAAPRRAPGRIFALRSPSMRASSLTRAFRSP